MTREERFAIERDIFRKFLTGFDENEVRAFLSDCADRCLYLARIRPESIIRDLTLETKDGKIPDHQS